MQVYKYVDLNRISDNIIYYRDQTKMKRHSSVRDITKSLRKTIERDCCIIAEPASMTIHLCVRPGRYGPAQMITLGNAAGKT